MAGTPQLLLNDGGSATYVSGTGSDTLLFNYTVAAGQNAGQLAITSVSLPAGASVADAAGNPANLAKAVGSPSGGPIIDTLRTRTDILHGTGQKVRAVAGNDVVVLESGNAKLVFHGSNDVAFLGDGGSSVNAKIIDHAQGLTVFVLSGGTDTIKGLATDPKAVVDLLGGVGGYANVTQVLNALTADPHGGTRLPLGSGQFLRFPDVAPAQLQAANFKLG